MEIAVLEHGAQYAISHNSYHAASQSFCDRLGLIIVLKEAVSGDCCPVTAGSGNTYLNDRGLMKVESLYKRDQAEIQTTAAVSALYAGP